MLKIHDVLINSANGIMSSNLKEEPKHFDGIIDLEALDAELRELDVYVKLYNFENSIKLKKVTIISTICEVANFKTSTKTLLPDLPSLLSLYHSLVLSSATAERTFSVMRRIKSYL